MASNLTVAMATVGSGPLKRVDTGATVGADGTSYPCSGYTCHGNCIGNN